MRSPRLTLVFDRVRAVSKVEIMVIFASIVFPLILWGPCIYGSEICFNDAGWADYRLHYLAIESYLNSSQWIPAYQQSFTWPHYSSLLYADAYPLPSILLWPIYKLIKFPVGLLFVSLSCLNSICIALLTILLKRRYCLQSSQLLFLSFFFITSPISWNRILSGHESLQLHALVLAPLIFLLVSCRNRLSWTILLVCICGINPYYLPFAACCFVLSTILPRTALNLRQKVLSLTAISVICLSVLFICGYIPGYSQNMSEIWGANMLSLFNPQGTSSLIEPLPVSEPFELEGYSYLGISLLLLCVITLLHSPSKTIFNYKNNIFQASIICALFLLLSWGLTWNISSQPIISPYLHLGLHKTMVSFYGVFRSAGRFTWPIYYLIVIWVVCTLKPYDLRRLLSLAFVLQLLELVLPLSSRINQTFSNRYSHGINPSHVWIANNNEVAEYIRQSSYFIVLDSAAQQSQEPSMPPYTPQTINPSIKANWGGANLSRRPSSALSPSQLLRMIPRGHTATIYVPGESKKMISLINENFYYIAVKGAYLHVTRL